MGQIDRRGFLRAGAGAVALAGLAACADRSASAPRTDQPRALIDPGDAPFDHVVVLTLTGRSFDHVLGWSDATGGRRTGLGYLDVDGVVQRPWDLGVDLAQCGATPIPHDWTDAAVHLGADDNEGFLLTVPAGDLTPLGYFSARAVPALRRLAGAFTPLGNYFAALNAGPVPNRMYLHAAATDLDTDGDTAISTTIWDRLQDAGLTGRCYGGTPPFVARFGSRFEGISRPYRSLAADARAGRLPSLAFVEPPPYPATRPDVRGDQLAITDVFAALRRGPQWERTVLVVHYDQYGGYFDHVPPPKVIDANVNPAPGPHPDYSQLGFRVPCVVVSPFSTAGPESGGAEVGGEAFEHCSILKMIEWRWDLEPLSIRDRNARNLAEVFDFTRARPTIPAFSYTPPAAPTCR